MNTEIDKEKLISTTSMIGLIGRTPLVRLGALCDPASAQIWAKCEQYNPGGSVKDRVALALIQEAELAGTIEPGKSTIIEPTSGNTGIGLAIVCSAKGYPLILTMPESMSLERRALLKSYGAEILLTPAAEDMGGAVTKALALVSENDNYYMPDQFRNPANPRVHERTTAPELLEQMGEQSIDAFVSGIGTGGTVSGVGRVLRKENADCLIIGVEPAASPVIGGGSAGPHLIQGIGAGFVPDNLDRALLSELRTVTDREAYDMSKRLAQELGLLVGISSGANVHVACDVASKLPPEQNVVTVLCDTGERYFSLDEHFE
jgi:cysteine synthase A